MEKQSLHVLSTATEERCHGDLQMIILFRVLGPRPHRDQDARLPGPPSLAMEQSRGV